MDFLKMLKKINRMFELVKTIQLMYVIKYQYNTDPHSTFARSLYKLALNWTTAGVFSSEKQFHSLVHRTAVFYPS